MKKTVFALLLALALLCAAAALAEGVTITLSDGEIACPDGTVQLRGRVLVLSGEGPYILTGSAADLQVKMNVPRDASAVLVLSGADWRCSFGPALWVNGDHAEIVCAEGTENAIADAPGRKDNSSSPSEALIYGTDDLSFTGAGTLRLTALLGHGAACKDYLYIDGPALLVQAANDGFHANDGLVLTSGDVTVTAGGDGLQAKNNAAGKGFLRLLGGTLTVTAQKDAFDAAGVIDIDGTKVTVYPVAEE